MNTIALAKTKSISFYPILLIGLCLLFPFYKYVLQIYPSIITTELMRDFKLTGAGLGNLAATFYYAYLITQCLVGILLDKFNIRYVMGVAMLTCAFGAYGFCFSHNTIEACFSRALMGIGVAFAPIAYMKITAMWCPPHRYAFINGLLATASMLGAIFGESILTSMIATTGWRESLFHISELGFIISICCFMLIKSKPQKNHSGNSFSFSEVIKIFKNKKNGWLCLYSGFAFSPLAIFGGLWGNPFLQQAYSVTKSQAASMISLIFIGLAFGGPLIGMLADKIGDRKKIMIYGTTLSLISLLIVLYARFLPLWFISSCLFTFGFSLGAYLLVFAIGKDINSLALTATVVALINASEAILDSLTEPFIGKMLDLGWSGAIVNGVHYFSLHSYQFVLFILPVYSLLAVLCLSRLRIT